MKFKNQTIFYVKISKLAHFHLFDKTTYESKFICVVGDSPMTRIMDLPKGYINQELSW